MQYVIVFDQLIRIGLNLIESVGPFSSLPAAEYWLLTENKKSIMPFPSSVIRSMIKPEDV